MEIGGDDDVVIVEVVVVNGEEGGRLNPVESRVDAVPARHVGRPRHEDGVHDAGGGPAGSSETVQQGGKAPRADALELRHEVVELRLLLDAVVVAVRDGGVGDEAIISYGSVGEHAVVTGDGECEGGEGAGAAGQSAS